MVRLFLLPFQLSLPGIGSIQSESYVVGSGRFDADGDPERDQRSSSEWHNAVIGYLKFRAGSSWRLGRSRYRNAPRYHEYLDAIRLIEEIRYQPELKPEPVLAALPYECTPAKLSWWRRPWDHFRRCRCQVCNSLRMRGIDPQSTQPDFSTQHVAKQPGRAVDAPRREVQA